VLLAPWRVQSRRNALGFQTLRNECPMNVRARNRRVPLTPQLQADIARIDEIWSGWRKRFGARGGWLFGDFSMPTHVRPVFFAFRLMAPR